jgi:protein-S-isoprenylcysteine O-methyltransferase Ste14
LKNPGAGPKPHGVPVNRSTSSARAILTREKLSRLWRVFQATKAYDAFAAAPLILWYGSSAGRLIPALAAKLESADAGAIDFTFVVSVLAQTAGIALIVLALVFLLLRRPAKAKAKGAMPRIAAIAGTYLGVAVVWLPAHPVGLALSLLSLLLILGGVGFASFALLHLGRSFSLMAEARRLVTNGPYGSIRHPLYLGEAISMLGLTLQYLSPLALLIMALQFFFQFERMRNEEQVLTALFPEYEAYRVRTARLIPGLY